MSDYVLSRISTLLQAKSHETNPMSRGAFVKELVSALNLPVSTINLALSNELQAAKWGIYKMTPNKRRNVLWGYSKDIAERTTALPFDVDSLTGIDPAVQAAEAKKLVNECENPRDHESVKSIKNNCSIIREMHGLSVDDWDDSRIVQRVFEIAATNWSEE